MFEKYVHTKEDLEAVEEALGYLERPELDFIFKERSLIEDTLVISFDSKEIFIWTKLRTSELKEMPCHLKGWNAYRVSHKIKLEDADQKGWCAGLKFKEALECLPKEFRKSWVEIPKISGSLLSPFVEIHKGQRGSGYRPLDSYYTKESYLATIIHEFGHVYYELQRPSYHADEAETTGYLKVAKNLYEGRTTSLSKVHIRFLSSNLVSETFAFCTDYHASSIFWPNHRSDVDAENRERMVGLLRKEKAIDLNYGSSVLGSPHNFAATMGKIILRKYPSKWPDILLKPDAEEKSAK